MKKIKVNPVMVNQKELKRIKASGVSEDTNEIKTFIIIVVVITILIGLIYGLTELLKKDNNIEDAIVAGKINYDRVSIGTMLNRPYDEYYVIIYDSSSNEAIINSTLISQYTSKSNEDNYLKIYFCDLGNKINNDFYNVNEDNVSNPNAKTIEELDLGDLTLIKVKNGKIVNYVEGYDKIEKILK